MNALLSIKPEFACKILEGTKKYEYRKRAFGKPVERIFVYASSPQQHIVGEIEVASVHSAKPSSIWQKTHKASGISYSYFKEYFSQKVEAFAIEVASVTIYDEPIDPFNLFDQFTPPQSYMYLDEDDVAKIRSAVTIAS
ncbi:MAG: ASCH domain-containing protein [Candidatus Babeliaceae bacterium]|nr:ASCH domain-containing protein [Candidatus Babeliaceae bacterium]